VGCIAGAQLADEMERDLYEAGFSKVMIVDSQVDLNVYAKLALEGGDGNPSHHIPLKDGDPSYRLTLHSL